MGSSTQQPALHDQRSDRDCIEHLRPLLLSPLLSLVTMAAPAKMRLRSEKHLSNITKRGLVSQPKEKESVGSSVGPWLLGFFVFVLVGSSLIQILRTAQLGL